MKTRFAVALAAAALTLISARPASGFVDISVGLQINARADFYTPLTPYGTWVNFSTYGRCWHPTQVDADWRPYCNGSWESTDAGLYWQSDEPWAWACYHYGSWYYDTGYGWVWIPGTDWAPAWVDWRYGDNYIGWAPCGPGRAVLGPSFFVFCDSGHFTGHFTPRSLIINNTTIINRTRVFSSFGRQTVNVDGRERSVFVNKGPGLDTFERATKQHFTPRPIGEVARQTPVPRNLRENANRPAQRNQPEQQRFNNNQPNQQQRNNEQPNHEAVPPTGREQPRQFEQPNRQTPPPTGREQPRQFEQPRQQPEQRQLQRPEQQRPEVTPAPTGRGEERNYNQSSGRERHQETPAPEQRATPAQRAVPPERSTPAERATPSQGAKPAERALPPTGRENAPPAGHEAPPAQRPETRPAPDGHGPAQAPGQEKKDGRDGQGQ